MSVRPLARLSFLLVTLSASMTASSPADAAWPTDPSVNVPVSASPTHFTNPEVATPDSCGGIIVAWEDVAGTVGQIYVQRVDALGQPRWGAIGFPIAPPELSQVFIDVASDGAGGAYVAWSELRVAATGRDIFMQHVLASGVVDPAWPAAGLTVCAAAGDQTFPRVVADGSGGAIAVWDDERGNVDFAPDIYAQRVNSAAAPMWAPDGVPVIVAIAAQSGYDVAPDGLGGVFVAWEDSRGADVDIYAQRLEAVAGAQVWGGGGLPLCTASGNQGRVAVTSESGRMLAAWDDGRGGATRDIYAQAIDLGGTILWAPNGALVCGNPADQVSPRIASDETGGAIVVWSDYRFDGFDDALFAQRVNSLGNRAWSPSDGVAVCLAPGRQLLLQIISDHDQGAIVGWYDFRKPLESDADIYAQRLSSAGSVLWTPDGAVVSSAPGHQTTPRIVHDGAGGAVLVWQDQRTDVDLYAQEIGAGGLVGVRAVSKNCEPDLCAQGYVDFGDAPEGIAAYATGIPGHFPTCTITGAAGTQEFPAGCPPVSPPPGPTGYVKHVQPAGDPNAFWLGCSASGPPPLFVDSETDGKTGGSGGLSSCARTLAVDCLESVSPGFQLGQDECYGDDDAGLAARVQFPACGGAIVQLETHGCGSGLVAAYLNVLVDWNHDGDWNDNVLCATTNTCVPEWAVMNQPVTIQPGCHVLNTPVIFAGPATGPAWMRVTLSKDQVLPDFPWNGSVSSPNGALTGGETEDYPVDVVPPQLGVDPTLASGEVQMAPAAPNPARGGTTVAFTLPKAAQGSVAVFDLAGRKLRTLASGTLAAGWTRITWDLRDDRGADVPSGFYLVRLEVGGRHLTQPVIRTR